MQYLLILTQAIDKASNFQSKLTLALEYMCELTAWDYGEVWIPYSQDILELSPAWYRSTRRGSIYTYALEQFRLCSEEFILSPGIGLPGRVWSLQQSEWIYDVSNQSEKYFLRNYIAKAFGIKTGLGVPIFVNHQPIAVLALFSLSARPEDKQLITTIETMVEQVGAML
ncbi:hypothetical protein B7486_44105 [cyanobacterium TDX16]|nr:hypothetical protein B7486_44105 [cyanobacterium TDX16]